ELLIRLSFGVVVHEARKRIEKTDRILGGIIVLNVFIALPKFSEVFKKRMHQAIVSCQGKITIPLTFFL
ncbi:MAG: hypothetical protein AABZ54_05870, partial [Bacteroidota bacterium]